MKLYNTTDITQNVFFKAFYRYYIAELSQYSKRLREEPLNIDEEVEKIKRNPLLKRYFITDEKHTPIGFLLLGFNENTQPGTDWFIAEFFIQPEARRKGYGRNAFKELLTEHPGLYCYFVLKENKPAYEFWAKVREEFGCTDIKNQFKCMHTPEDCTFEAFECFNSKV